MEEEHKGSVRTCPRCSGQGKRYNPLRDWFVCEVCDGTGRVVPARDDVITITDGERVLTFPKMEGEAARRMALAPWNVAVVTINKDLAVAGLLKLVMQGADDV